MSRRHTFHSSVSSDERELKKGQLRMDLENEAKFALMAREKLSDKQLMTLWKELFGPLDDEDTSAERNRSVWRECSREGRTGVSYQVTHDWEFDQFLFDEDVDVLQGITHLEDASTCSSLTDSLHLSESDVETDSSLDVNCTYDGIGQPPIFRVNFDTDKAIDGKKNDIKTGCRISEPEAIFRYHRLTTHFLHDWIDGDESGDWTASLSPIVEAFEE